MKTTIAQIALALSLIAGAGCVSTALAALCFLGCAALIIVQTAHIAGWI